MASLSNDSLSDSSDTECLNASDTAQAATFMPPRPDYANLRPTAEDVFSDVPPRPNYSGLRRGPPPRPSEGWLRNPAWIDGGRNPPLFFHSHEEVDDTLRYFNPDHPSLHRDARDVSPPPPQAPWTQMPQVPPPAYATMAPTAQPTVITAPHVNSGVAARNTSNNADNTNKHQVTATMLYTSVQKANPSTRSRPTSKKIKSSKLSYIRLEGISRSDFIKEYLKLHDLDNDYSPGVHSGPSFKMSWTGSRGGRAGAISIDDNQDFELAKGAILLKSKVNCHVTVEFDVDDMSHYRISNKRPRDRDEDEENIELSYGTKVPRLENYSAHEQLQGDIVHELKKKWTCERHQGEHAEPGYCYVDSSGSHLGLNHRKLSLWAAAIAARDATKHEPPNTVDFDGLRDGQLTSNKPRGRVGPRAHHVDSSSNDAVALTMAAIVPILASLVPKHSPRNPPSTPVRRDHSKKPQTPSRSVHLLSPFSPVPAESVKIHTFLNDFYKVKSIDVRSYESLLMEIDFTPDIIPTVPVARLCEIMDITEGLGWKLHGFAREWNERVELKKRSV